MPAESILLSADFETGDPLQSVFSASSLPVYPGYSAQIDSSISRKGTKSCRMELRSTDQLMTSGRRSELTLNSTNPLNPFLRWFAFSVFFPADYISSPVPEIHFQIADNTGLTAPNLAIWVINNEFFINQKYNIGAGNVEVQTKISGDAKLNLGGWDDFVIHYVPAIDGSGSIKVYRNGVEVFTTSGPNANMQGGVVVPSRYPKFGTYLWRWNTPGTYYPNVRVVWFDEIKYGNDTATLSDFAITDTPTTPPAGPGGGTAVEGFVFISG